MVFAFLLALATAVAPSPEDAPAVAEAAAAGPCEPAEVAEAAPGEADPEDALGEDGEEEDDGESEEHAAAPGEIPEGHRYTADLSDEELARLWLEDPKALGTISIGFTDSGRMINAEQFPEGAAWTVVSPPHAWAVREVIEFVTAAIEAVAAEHPDSPRLRVNHLSSKDGGHLRPHKSHQSGRDVDLALYYRGDIPPGWRGKRENVIDPARNWSLIRALVTLTDVQVILLDKRLQKVIYDHALAAGEDREWLDSLFSIRGGRAVQHAKRHYDHYHVRFYAPRSQELGRRVQPLLAQRPEENRAFHKVRRGDTLGAIARRFGTTVKALQKANSLRGHNLTVGRTLMVPLRGPCTHCPLPPPVSLPPRRLPPQPSVEPVVEAAAARTEGA